MIEDTNLDTLEDRLHLFEKALEDSQLSQASISTCLFYNDESLAILKPEKTARTFANVFRKNNDFDNQMHVFTTYILLNYLVY